MISSVTLKNYKAHRDTTIELGRFTVLVGPNGSGKTSVLEAIDKLAHSHHEGTVLVSELGDGSGKPRFYRRQGSGPFEISLQCSDGGRASAKAIWDPSAAQTSSSERAWNAEWTRDTQSGRNDPTFHRIVELICGKTVLYRFEPALLALPSASVEERPALANNGANTADVLASLKLDDEALFDRVEQALRAVIPQVKRIRIQRQKLDDSGNQRGLIGQKIVLDFHGATDIPAEDISEGTLVALALVTAVCAGARPQIVLLDDLGLALHPTAQMELVRQLQRLLAEAPNIQILATTHSPYILDEMKPEDVVVLAPRDDGSIASKRLSEHPDAKMSGYLTTGELWGLGSETTWVL